MLTTKKHAVGLNTGISAKASQYYIVHHERDSLNVSMHTMIKYYSLGTHVNIHCFQNKWIDFMNSVCLDVLKMFGNINWSCTQRRRGSIYISSFIDVLFVWMVLTLVIAFLS